MKVQNFDATFQQLGLYTITEFFCLAMHFFVVLGAIYYMVVRKNPLQYFKGQIETLILAFSTSSRYKTAIFLFYNRFFLFLIRYRLFLQRNHLAYHYGMFGSFGCGQANCQSCSANRLLREHGRNSAASRFNNCFHSTSIRPNTNTVRLLNSEVTFNLCHFLNLSANFF